MEVVGLVAASVAAAAAIAVEDRRVRAVAMPVALALSAAIVAGEAWENELRELRDSPALMAAAIAGAVAGIGALALVVSRWEEALPLALLAVLPFRVPIEAGGESSNLLVPLYAVVAAGAVAYVARSGPAFGLGDAGGAADRGPRVSVTVPLRVALAATVVVYGLQSAYSDDVSRAAQNVAFFHAPFAVLYVLLVETRWSTRLLKAALAVVVVEALVLAGVGIAQHELRFTFWNDALAESNEFHFYFRVNSLFWDSNFYGRYLAVALVLVVAWLLWERDLKRLAGATLIGAVIALGFAFGFSQTSSAALLVGLAVLAALRWSLRLAALACAGLAMVGVAGLLAFGEAIEFDFSSLSLERQTSGRAGLVEGGIELAGDRPVQGHGSGSFVVLYREQNDLDPDIAAVSHTEPVTIAAEQGAVGLLIYVALLAAAAMVLLSGMRRLAPGIAGRGLSGFPDTDTKGVARIAILACFVAMVVHSFGYAAFLTDPLTWALIAIGAALGSPRQSD